MKRILCVAMLINFVCLGLPGQEAKTASPVADTIRSQAERRGKIMAAAAEEMPPDKFGFKPTPAQMSFGELTLHIAKSNNFLCSGISGTPEPADLKLTEKDPKEKLTGALKASFDYCATALSKVDDSRLTEQVPFFGGRQVTRAAAMIALSNDWADHYAAQAMYLRLNGLLPPTAQKSSGTK